MVNDQLTWELVDAVAADLGAKDEARRKWRDRGIPADWRIKIAQHLESGGRAFTASDFDAFDALGGGGVTGRKKIQHPSHVASRVPHFGNETSAPQDMVKDPVGTVDLTNLPTVHVSCPEDTSFAAFLVEVAEAGE